MELDIKAAVSVMSYQEWKRMFGETVAIELCKGKQLQGYSGHEAQVIGLTQVEVRYGHQKHQLPLLVVAENQIPPLFSHNWLQNILLNCAVLDQLRKMLC